MTRKIISSVMVTGAAFTLMGCGGSSDTASSVGTVATGTAFYIDSAVSGVNYKCGSTEGITDTYGTFTFEVGSSCTFYLGDMELRGVDAGLLVDGENVYETDVEIARILQSLDSNGNPDDGITIDADTVEALAEHGIDSLPTSEAEMDEMLAVIAANGGTEVSEEDAAAHMLTTLLGGKIFYVVDESDDGSKQVTKLTFNEDLTSIEAISPEMTENWGITIEGSKLTFNGDTDGSYTIVTVDQANDYIMFTDYYSDGSLDGMGHRLYRDKADAEAYFDSLKNPDLEALIVGKTFYQHCQDNGSDWIATITFGTDGTMTIVDNDVREVATYRIEGDTLYEGESGSERAHILTEYTAEYIQFDASADSKFYVTSALAQAATAFDCGGDFSFTTDYLNGKSLFYVQYDDFGYEDVGMKWNMARMAFAENTFSWTEYDTVDTGTHTFTYSVNSDGNIVYDYGDGNQHVISSNEITNDYIKVCQDGDCNTYLFFDETKARDFRDSQDGDESSNPAPTPTEFTQELVSLTPWYVVEYEADVAYCNGVFTMDGNSSLTVSWNDPGDSGSATGSYLIVDGKFITSHDGKTETETLLAYENGVITTEKAKVYDDGSTPPPSINKKWFNTQAGAESFLSSYTNPEASSCF